MYRVWYWAMMIVRVTAASSRAVLDRGGTLADMRQTEQGRAVGLTSPTWRPTCAGAVDTANSFSSGGSARFSSSPISLYVPFISGIRTYTSEKMPRATSDRGRWASPSSRWKVGRRAAWPTPPYHDVRLEPSEGSIGLHYFRYPQHWLRR